MTVMSGCGCVSDVMWVWVGWCVVWFWTTGISAQNQCTLNNGQCYYNIQLSPSCKDDISLQTNRLQNDYNERVNEIQKSLTVVSTDHSKRIQDLESKLSHLIGGGGAVGGGNVFGYGSETIHRKHRHSKNEKFQGKEDRRENELLNMLHEQFSVLRRDIAASKRKIREQDRLLRDTRLKLNKTEEALLDTTKKLIKTEQNLADTKAENWRLRQEIEERDLALNKTKEKLLETIRKLRDTELELLAVKDENAQLKSQLRDANLLLESTRKLLANALRKYHELNLRHEITVQDLNNKTEQLVTCYRGKTSQFCGFEDEDLCGFSLDASIPNLIEWTRHRMATPQGWTGPSVDHTCGNHNGYYMYVEAKNRGQGKMARIISPKYQGMVEQCVQFYYHMWGRNIGTLNVYTRVSEEEFIPAWRAYGNQGDVWTSARMPIPEDVARKGYKVIFESILENGAEGDIAIDDFRVFDGKCYHVRTAGETKKRKNEEASDLDVESWP